MIGHLPKGIALVLLARLGGGGAPAADGWVGHKVILRSSAVPLRVGKDPIAVGPLQRTFLVTQEQGGWLWVRDGGLAGWVRPWELVKTEHSVDFFSEILARRPGTAWAYLGRGLAWEARGEARLALKDYDEAVRLAPDDPAARIDRGSLRRERGDKAGALEDLERAVQLEPGAALARLDRGQTRRDLGDLDGALADLDAAIRLQPDQAAAFSARGELRRSRGDDHGAEADFVEAIRLDPASAAADPRRVAPRPDRNDPELVRLDERGEGQSNIPNPLLVRGREPWKSSDAQLDKEVAANEEVLHHDPNNYKAVNDRGLARFERGDLQGALADANRQIQLAPTVLNGYANRAVALRELGEFDRAIADSTEAIRMLPNSPVVYNNRAIAYADKKDFTASLADFDQALRLDPRMAFVYGNRGGVYAKMGDYARASADNVYAMALDPTLSIAFHHQGYLRAACPDPEFRNGKEAIPLTIRACALTFWNNPHTLNGYAAALAEDGQFDLAARWQNRALELLPGTKYRADYLERLQLYKAGKPYRMAVPDISR